MTDRLFAVPSKTVISLSGFTTNLGGMPLSDAVASAMYQASARSWTIKDLQEWAGRAIADATGAEAACVTSGASAGLTLASAICAIDMPRSTRQPEIIIQRSHRNPYDRAFEVYGQRLREVGFPSIDDDGVTYEWEFEQAISEETCAIVHLARADHCALSLERVCEIAARFDVPVIVDAADELPPAQNLRRFLEHGASLVVYSGGKAIRGPQGTGVVAGRAGLVQSILYSTLDMHVDAERWRTTEGAEPPHQGWGRGFKVSKEEIVGLVAAIHEFLARDHESEREEMSVWLEEVRRELGDESAQIKNGHGFYPRLVIQLACQGLAVEWQGRLAAEDPALIVPHFPLRNGQIIVCPESVMPADRDYVTRSLLGVASDLARQPSLDGATRQFSDAPSDRP